MPGHYDGILFRTDIAQYKYDPLEDYNTAWLEIEGLSHWVSVHAWQAVRPTELSIQWVDSIAQQFNLTTTMHHRVLAHFRLVLTN